MYEKGQKRDRENLNLAMEESSLRVITPRIQVTQYNRNYFYPLPNYASMPILGISKRQQ